MKKKEKKARSFRYRLEATCTKNEKDRLIKFCKEKKITMSELIQKRLLDLPVPDYSIQENFRATIETLIKEINAIGNNINQSTMLLNLIYGNKKISNGEYENLQNAIDKYNGIMRELRGEISKLIFK